MRRRSGSSSGIGRQSADLGAKGADLGGSAGGERSKSLAASIKDAVTGVAAPLRPSSRGAQVRRRPAPKGITKDAVQLERASPKAQGMSTGDVAAAAAAAAGPGAGAAMSLQYEGQNHSCNITTDADGPTEIRTKVFRMGAPLLRSTIPVSLGSRTAGARPTSAREASKQKPEDDDEEVDSDVESVLSLSDVGIDDQGALSITLDFPC